MNPEDTPQENDRFADLLAAYDDALAAGRTPDPDVLTSDSPELAQRLHQARACLRRLEDDRLRALTPPAAGDSSLAFSPRGELLQMGRFQVVRELGRGGCGIVYLAFDLLLRREVALKVPRPDALETPELRRRFLNEARAAAGLDHPNVVAVHEVGEAGPFCYLVATYCPGTSLADWLKQQPGPVAPETAAALVATLAEAVHYVHGRGILHRDLKPANVLLQRADKETENGNAASLVPKITDFGLAKWIEDPGGETKTGMVLGTPGYMAPEQALGQVRAIGPATDVYALGAILYELVTGRTPFQSETDRNVLKQVVSQEPVPPRRLRPKLPRDLEAVCLKCLEKDPRRRYGSAQELAEDLGRWLQKERPRVGRLPFRLRRGIRRHPLAGLVAALVVAAAVLTPLTVYLRNPERRLERIQAELAKGQAVELIGATGPPSWYQTRLWLASNAIWNAPDEPFALYSPDLFLVELVRDLPVPAYRFEVEVNHMADVGDKLGEVGLYCLLNGPETDPAQHWFGTLGFNNLVKIDRPEGNPVEFEVRHVFEPPGGPWTSSWYQCPKPPLVSFDPSEKVVWRQLAVEVTPTRLVLQWENGPQQEIGYAELARVAAFRQHGLGNPFPPAIPPVWSPRTGLGLFVANCKAAFRHVVIKPLDRQ